MNADQAAPRMAPERDVLGSLMSQYPQVSRLKWRNGVIRRLSEFGLDDPEREDVESIVREFPFLPDAFACYPDEKRIDIFEAEVTSMMKRRKMDAYARMMMELDFFGIDMHLLTINQHGHMNAVDLMEHYLLWSIFEGARR